ncbi:MAG: NADPH-dependent F420 reductase [Alphaproteobacteria bacterium]|nr:NADPH-dependent F420 reductase [Alphaproteobacteria bacterium]
MVETKPRIAILGGTGDLGSGLALRWARAGYGIVIGSRKLEGAQAAAKAFNAEAGVNTIAGLENAAAAAAAEIVVLTVPYANHRAMLEAVKPAVQGKIFVDVTVPLQAKKVRTVSLPPEGSVAKAAQAFLGEGVRVVSAFQNVAAERLRHIDERVECDVLVAGNDPQARDVVVGLAEAAGLKAWHAGRIDNSAVAEALTSVLIFINGRYGIAGAGLRITGTPGSAAKAAD